MVAPDGWQAMIADVGETNMTLYHLLILPLVLWILWKNSFYNEMFSKFAAYKVHI